MNIILKNGDVVWSGVYQTTYGTSTFYIRIHDKFAIRGTNNGCACPKEAVDFLRTIGIRVEKTKAYESGYSASGCEWIPGGSKELSPHIKKVLTGFQNKENKFMKNVLMNLED